MCPPIRRRRGRLPLRCRRARGVVPREIRPPWARSQGGSYHCPPTGGKSTKSAVQTSAREPRSTPAPQPVDPPADNPNQTAVVLPDDSVPVVATPAPPPGKSALSRGERRRERRQEKRADKAEQKAAAVKAREAKLSTIIGDDPDDEDSSSSDDDEKDYRKGVENSKAKKRRIAVERDVKILAGIIASVYPTCRAPRCCMTGQWTSRIASCPPPPLDTAGKESRS